MEDSMKQLMEMLSAMKVSQEEMKRGQKDMKEDMKRGQEEMKEDMKRGQEEMKASQEEVKASQEKLQLKLQAMKRTIEDSNNTKLENKLKEFEEVVEVNQVKEEVKAIEGELSHMKEDAKTDKKEMNKKMEDLEIKFRQLSTTGVIKTEGIVTTPSKVKLFEVKHWKHWKLVVVENNTRSPNYATLTSALEKRYGDAHLQHVYQVQLRNKKQRFEKTLQQYEADISRMVEWFINLAYPTAPAEVIEQLSVSSFIEGLRDPEFGQLVRLARHKTISEALVHALEIEAVKEVSRVAINTYQRRDKQTRITDGNMIESLLELLQQFK
ncbi:hypothetical protein NQ315_015157 [Exocentrus adspersus]|uniref:Uncharacterized protein n=1 Tax=Exocentrus adspersus TaxID=1586481 RepID=A0AAV8VES7_9CUCU|nr:hypothetical protein NQ315_015157 [Exocentrus adspersus]